MALEKPLFFFHPSNNFKLTAYAYVGSDRSDSKRSGGVFERESWERRLPLRQG